ncbi:hypothetical protein [Bacillus wiedmannii]|uniref:hypothetical protein n=1 Tax=Bacillus wiedmannii TaxID=1890302 RepID=UPI000BF1E27B|nr:hypothetical protein [Bacillus wiedmannii]PEO36761.1 hypothetical protein CN555_21405 [Bacillus wiedmannii]
MKLSNSFRVTEVKKKTQASFFKDLKVGDVFSMSFNLKGGYHSAPMIELTSEHGKARKYASQVFQQLKGFEPNFSVVQSGVTLSQQAYNGMHGEAEKYRKLEAYGVDNWSGYGMAMSDEEGIFE